MARRYGKAIAILALVTACAGCGSGITYGVAPGPAEPEPPKPKPDAGPEPERDAGPPPLPPDGGENCTQVELPPPTQEESVAEFSALGLGAQFGCASCHTGSSKSPTETGINWGPGLAAPEPADWFDAANALAARDEAAGTPIEASSLYVHFNRGPNGTDGIHPVNEDGKTKAVAWLSFLWEPRYELVCEEPPDAGPDCTPLPYPETDSRAYFEANLQATAISCSSCHRGPPSGANGNLQFDEASAHDVMAERIETGAASPEETTAGKVFRVNGASLPGHGFAFSESAEAATWIQNHLDGVPPAGCP